MSVWNSSLSESERHSLALQLNPSRIAIADFLQTLGDPSWRVRRAALENVSRFSGDPLLVEGLVRSLSNQDNAGLRNAASDALVQLGESSLDGLTLTVKSSDPDVRKFAVEGLGLIGGRRAERALLAVLEDPDSNVQAAAAEALGRIGGSDTVISILRVLEERGGDLHVATYILDALANLRAQVPLSRLERFREVLVLRRSLYELLGFADDVEAVPWLIEGASQGSRGNRAAAIVALGRLSQSGKCERTIRAAVAADDPVREFVLKALRDDEDDVRAAAVRIVQTLGDPRWVPEVLDACACRSNVELGFQVAMELGAEVVGHLLDSIYDVGVESRVLFLEVVESLGERRHVVELLELAESLETRSAEAAIRVIGTLGDADAVEALIALLSRVDPDLERQVAQAIIELGRRYPDVTAAQVAQEIASAGVRPAWLMVLGSIGRQADICQVRYALNHHQESVRIAAYHAAHDYGARFPIEHLIFGVSDESPEVRAAAARALGNHRVQLAVDVLLAAAKDRDSRVAAEALKALGEMEGFDVVGTVRLAICSSDPILALAALSALSRLNPPGLSEWLAAVLDHTDPEVVREAVTVSAVLPGIDATPLLLRGLEHRFWAVRRASAAELARRDASVPSDLLHSRLGQEREPLVLELLRGLRTTL